MRPTRIEDVIAEAREHGPTHGGGCAAPIVDSLVTGTTRVIYGNVRNGSSIENLPPDACVEVACVADRNGVRPLRFGRLPAACAALNEVQIAVQRLVVEAASRATETSSTRPSRSIPSPARSSRFLASTR